MDLAAVAVAVGEVPTFRALVPGARGADVNQLQRMLVATGHRTAAPDGLFDSATLAQLNLWQRATGQRATGSVPLGSLLFVKRLPAVVGWEDTLNGESSGGGKGVVGTLLTEGDTVARLLPATPSFSIDLPPGQRALVEPGMRVSLNLKDHSWSAQIDAIRAPREDGSAVATLAAIGDRKSICGRQCDSVAIAGDSSVKARITVLAPASGPVIPTAALVVGPDGSTAVVTDGGETVAVIVVATSGGQALIEGVVAGTKLRVPGDVETTQ
ncbi:peptidoglycan-binding domain-containing protein [Nocardioides sp. B-3]|uniref:peptidoglycan-binding domain-containing protein n=1 Tax=Nocardioides sp. B-3 TaxID=2895565 RepID=UPI002152C51F|nr:peptidoglycan-binding domain-containing protein [Nocardioides sp. B-3]UUZ60898.1 peptidoglycan-binding protein [Nocardioides sp. B-3]